MKIKAIVYDTPSRKPREITPRFVMLTDDGKPKHVVSQNGIRYREVKIWDDSQPCKYNDFKGTP